MKIQTTIFILISLKNIHGLLISPCPEIFAFEPLKSEEDRWYGVITISSREIIHNIQLEMHFDQPVITLGNWLGKVKSSENHKIFIIESASKNVEPDKALKTEIFVIYNPENVQPPQLTKIVLNGQEICPNSISTQENIKVELNETRILSNNIPTILDNLNQSTKCGLVAVRSVSLVTHGQDTQPGQWPWHSALYEVTDSKISYRCGGTLISEKHILSAAHCITNKRSSNPKEANSLLVILGKQTFKQFSLNEVRVNISQVMVHPNYNHTTFFNDIGILELKHSVKFTNYIQPICLWEDDSDLQTVLNKVGIVVGWGFNENREFTENLMQAQMPVVDTLKCIYSNRQFYSLFTTDNNFCAGFLNGTSVCNGDSGGAMVFPKKGTSNIDTQWQIRGIVSNTVPISGQAICDTNYYVIFTDVAKHLKWIHEIIAIPDHKL